MWLKLVNNVGLNSVSALRDMTIRPMLADPVARAEVRALMIEALRVGQAMGVVADVDVDARIEYAARLADVKTSMLQDLERGRDLELDPILGAVVELADRYGVPVPHVRESYAALRQAAVSAFRAMDDIAALAGVGPKTAALFRELGIDTPDALLEYLPFRYEDLRFPTPAARLGNARGEENAVGVVVGLKERRVRDLEIVEAVDCATIGAIRSSPNGSVSGASSTDVFARESDSSCAGAWSARFAGAVVNVGHYAVLGEGRSVSRRNGAGLSREQGLGDAEDRVRSSRRTSPSSSRSLRPTACRAAIARVARLPCRCAKRIARPTRRRRPEEAERARERFIFGEFLALATAAQLRRAQRERDRDARALRVPPGLLEEFCAALPFALTGAQRRVDRRDLGRHDARRPDEPAAAGRRRERKDARRGGGDRAGVAQRRAIRADGPDRDSRVAARR